MVKILYFFLQKRIICYDEIETGRKICTADFFLYTKYKDYLYFFEVKTRESIPIGNTPSIPHNHGKFNADLIFRRPGHSQGGFANTVVIQLIH